MAISHANRGMAFQNLVDYTNKCYLQKGIAHIVEIPTSWKVIRRGKKIISAFSEEKSIVDFLGIHHGRTIAFDAKSTNERTRFPLDNVHQHQVNFLKSWFDQGAVTFLLVEFVKHREVYYVTFNQFNEWWEGQYNGGRKSIPYSWFQSNCELVKSESGIPLHFLKFIKGREEHV